MRLSFPKYKQDGKTCRGIRLEVSYSLAFELWCVPSRFVIAKHRHPNLDIELTTIFADEVAIHRTDKETGKTEFDFPETHIWPFYSRTYTIKSYHWHTFRTGNLPFVFFNRERRALFSTTFTSAAQDFELYPLS